MRGCFYLVSFIYVSKISVWIKDAHLQCATMVEAMMQTVTRMDYRHSLGSSLDMQSQHNCSK